MCPRAVTASSCRLTRSKNEEILSSNTLIMMIEIETYLHPYRHLHETAYSKQRCTGSSSTSRHVKHGLRRFLLPLESFASEKWKENFRWRRGAEDGRRMTETFGRGAALKALGPFSRLFELVCQTSLATKTEKLPAASRYCEVRSLLADSTRVPRVTSPAERSTMNLVMCVCIFSIKEHLVSRQSVPY